MKGDAGLSYAKAEIKNPRTEWRVKAESTEKLKRMNTQLLSKIQELNLKIEIQTVEMNAITEDMQFLEDLNCSINEKIFIIKRSESDNFGLEQKVRALEEEIVGLKGEKEQFTEFKEAHRKLKDHLLTKEAEWEIEKSTLIDEISTWKANLDSQTRVSEDLQRKLEAFKLKEEDEELSISLTKLQEAKLLKIELDISNCFANNVPILDEKNYYVWKDRMKRLMKAIDKRMLQCVLTGPLIPNKVNTDPKTAATYPYVKKPKKEWTDEDKAAAHIDARVSNIISSTLDFSTYQQVMFCTLINTCESLGEIHSNREKNVKFLNGLGSEWHLMIVCIKECKDLSKMSLRSLYSHLKVYEQEIGLV